MVKTYSKYNSKMCTKIKLAHEKYFKWHSIELSAKNHQKSKYSQSPFVQVWKFKNSSKCEFQMKICIKQKL